MSDKFKEVIALLLAYGFDFTVDYNNVYQFYYASYKKEDRRTVWLLKDKDETNTFSIYDGANTSWINAKNYSAEDCMNTIDAICCDFQD